MSKTPKAGDSQAQESSAGLSGSSRPLVVARSLAAMAVGIALVMSGCDMESSLSPVPHLAQEGGREVITYWLPSAIEPADRAAATLQLSGICIGSLLSGFPPGLLARALTAGMGVSALGVYRQLRNYGWRGNYHPQHMTQREQEKDKVAVSSFPYNAYTLYSRDELLTTTLVVTRAAVAQDLRRIEEVVLKRVTVSGETGRFPLLFAPPRERTLAFRSGPGTLSNFIRFVDLGDDIVGVAPSGHDGVGSIEAAFNRQTGEPVPESTLCDLAPFSLFNATTALKEDDLQPALFIGGTMWTTRRRERPT